MQNRTIPSIPAKPHVVLQSFQGPQVIIFSSITLFMEVLVNILLKNHYITVYHFLFDLRLQTLKRDLFKNTNNIIVRFCRAAT